MSVQFESLNKVTLTEQVMQQLAAKIISGELKPGEKLPPERELSQMLEVSRSRIREALRALSLIGFVTIKPGGGTFVGNQIDEMPEETIVWLFRQKVSNYHEVYEARRLIETAVYLACFERKTDEIVISIRKRVTLLAQAYADDCTPEKFNALLEGLDIYVAQNCGNDVFYKLMQTIILLRREAALKILESPYERKSSVEKRSLVALEFERGDYKSVSKAINAFFDNSVKDFTFSS
ncbi:FadR/GntR family transcriptional regulator [Oscillibacter sp. GMB15532]|uniref:FadR/GntR family transcriptional regulator n=1 Tax=Oscillibacter sp. GMB15532 TaxID=3230022 RepID=UPI0034DDF6E6